MDEAAKMQALPLSEVRERLLSKRQDGFAMAQRPSDSPPPAAENVPQAKPAPAAPPVAPKEERICRYSKCGVKFTPKRRKDQVYHSADCRKRDWFESHFVPIAKPEGGA